MDIMLKHLICVSKCLFKLICKYIDIRVRNLVSRSVQSKKNSRKKKLNNALKLYNIKEVKTT